MPVFNIYMEQSLGFSHSGEVTAEGEGNVELTDEEVRQLVDLIKENGEQTDVEQLGLETKYPAIFEKLKEACREVAYKAEYNHWVIAGYENGWYEEPDNMIETGEKYGFKFEFDEAKFREENWYEENEEIDEDAIEDAKKEAFFEWVEEYRESLDEDADAEFLANVFDLDPNVDDVDYTVEMPVDIVNMAMNNNSPA